MATQASLEWFTFFLSDLDDFDGISKDSYCMPKNVVSKNKVNYRLTLLV